MPAAAMSTPVAAYQACDGMYQRACLMANVIVSRGFLDETGTKTLQLYPNGSATYLPASKETASQDASPHNFHCNVRAIV